MQDSGELKQRTSTSIIRCCKPDAADPPDQERVENSPDKSSSANVQKLTSAANNHQRETYITGVVEPAACVYEIYICSVHMCADRGDEPDANLVEDDLLLIEPEEKIEDTGITNRRKSRENSNPGEIQSSEGADFSVGSGSKIILMSPETQLEYREKVRGMFVHAYDSYMQFAFPAAELRPLSCTGGPFDLIKIDMVTLLDTLDTLIILGNYTEFRRAVALISETLPSFDFDVNVSVFETNIRILGSLLAAHLMAVDPELGIYDGLVGNEAYNSHLLRLAVDIGERLMPAFVTSTGIPYGTVN